MPDASESMIRFMNRPKDTNGEKLHWHRASHDGAPYRGHAPMMTGDEYEDRVHKVADPHLDLFDIADAKQKAHYLYVLDGAANGWFQILYIKRPGEYDPKNPSLAYVEWLQFYMEDGSRTPFMSQGMMEVQGGTSNGMVVQG